MSVSRDSLSSVVKNARRGAAMPQLDLAEEVGCTQSAISMFEAGKHDALSAKNLQAVALMLGLDIESLPSREELKPSPEILKYCPIDECPSNIPYVVHGRVLAKPSLTSAPSARKSRCRDGGELLEAMCTECQAPVSAYAFEGRAGYGVTPSGRGDRACTCPGPSRPRRWPARSPAGQDRYLGAVSRLH